MKLPHRDHARYINLPFSSVVGCSSQPAIARCISVGQPPLVRMRSAGGIQCASPSFVYFVTVTGYGAGVEAVASLVTGVLHEGSLYGYGIYRASNIWRYSFNWVNLKLCRTIPYASSSVLMYQLLRLRVRQRRE